MRKQVLSMVLVASLLFGITATVALANGTQTGVQSSTASPEKSPLYLEAFNFTDEGSTPAEGEGYIWNASTRTLTLSGVTVVPENDGSGTHQAALWLPEGAVIELQEGTVNVFRGADTDVNGALSFGIVSADDATMISAESANSITIRGTGQLFAVSGNAIGLELESTSGLGNTAGIYAKDIAVEGDVKVTATGGDSNSYVGSSSGVLAVSQGNIRVKDSAELTAVGGTATKASYGIYAIDGDLSVENNGRVTAFGGTLSNSGTDQNFGESNGIRIGSEVNIIDNATVTAYGGSVTTSDGYAISRGIYADSFLNISGSAKVTAVAGDANGGVVESHGLHIDNGDLVVDGDATVIATGSKVTGSGFNTDSVGVYCLGDVTLKGNAKVTATGGRAIGNAEASSYGFMVKKVYVQDNAEVSATGGDADDTGGTTSIGICSVNSDPVQISGGVTIARSGSATRSVAINFEPNLSNGIICAAGANDENYAVYAPSDTFKQMMTTGLMFDNNTPSVNEMSRYGYRWEHSSKTLYINGLNINVEPPVINPSPNPSATQTSMKGLEFDGDDAADDNVTIVVEGKNILNTHEKYGIAANLNCDKLTIIGNGSLVTIGKSEIDSTAGIYANDLDISGVSLMAMGGTANFGFSAGIHAKENLTISNAKVIATGGTGIKSFVDVGSYGIYTEGSLKINTDSDITATGGTADNYSRGIRSVGEMEISSSKVTAMGGVIPDSQESSCGIYADDKLIISEASAVTATGGMAGGSASDFANSYGIFLANSIAREGIRINGSEVMATGGSSDYDSCGINAGNNALLIENGSAVTAFGGSVKDYQRQSSGVYSSAMDEISVVDSCLVAFGGTVLNEESISYGIDGGGGSFNNSVIVAFGGTAVNKGLSRGIKISITNKSVTMDDCDVTGIGGTAVNSSIGFEIGTSAGSPYSFTITGDSKVKVVGGTIPQELSTSFASSIGISSIVPLIIDDARVDASGASAEGDKESAGIRAQNTLLIKNNSNVTASGGNAPLSCGVNSTGEITIRDNSYLTAYSESFAVRSGSDIKLISPIGVLEPSAALVGSYDDGYEFKTILLSGIPVKNAVIGPKDDNNPTTTDKPKSSPSPNTDDTKAVYSLLSGDNQIYTRGSKVGLTFKSDGAHINFRNAFVNGEKARRDEDYTDKSGSTIVYLKPKYLDKMKTGVHSLRIAFANGYVDARFTVKDPEKIKKLNNPFTDVYESDWFYNTVLTVYNEGLFSGTTETTFSPQQTLTRGMFVAVLARVDKGNLSSYTSSPFTDVDMSMYYGKPIAWAEANGIFSGMGLSDEFAPEQNITREEMAVMLSNYIKFKEISLEEIQTSPFADIQQASPWARAAIADMKRYGIIHGQGGNLYSPMATATRAEAAQIFLSFLELIRK